MIVLTHIVIALSSLAYSAYVFFYPSKAKLRISYALVASTIASGTYLVWSTHAPMLQSCLTGLTYLGFILVATVLAQHKLAISSEE